MTTQIEDILLDVMNYNKFKKIESGEDFLTRAQFMEIGLRNSPRRALAYSVKNWLNYHYCIQLEKVHYDKRIIKKIFKKMCYEPFETQEEFLKGCKNIKKPSKKLDSFINLFIELVEPRDIGILLYTLVYDYYMHNEFKLNLFNYPEEFFELSDLDRYTIKPYSLIKTKKVLKKLPMHREAIREAYSAHLAYYMETTYLETDVREIRNIRMLITDRIKLRGYKNLEQYIDMLGITMTDYNRVVKCPRIDDPIIEAISNTTRISKGSIVFSLTMKNIFG